ncbi:MAG: Mycofactocin system glycosyltransferase [Frankiales bacterium]|nr:Mycofactocin system glycosyltransferase [Frankiales bacterium]
MTDGTGTSQVGPHLSDAIPFGWPLELDPRTRRMHDDRVLLSPTGRLLRLGPQGPRAVQDLLAGRGAAAALRLGRTLLDAGAAHPQPPAHPADDVTVVVPVKDRTAELEQCLRALDADVLVVDDGSDDPAAVEAVARRHGASYVHRPNGGPAAARNTAMALLRKDFVAFLDSDCIPPAGWLESLRGHLVDPAVGAVAPRVIGGPRSPLDLGPRPAVVRPGGAVAYVPTAALLVRRTALMPFDEGLRYGEDVDLVWRMLDAGWQVRYDPAVVVEHAEPRTLTARLTRRFRYGTAAAPLSRRHPERLAHLVLPPWPTAVVALLLARRPVLAAVVAGWSTARLDRHLDDLPSSVRVVAASAGGTAIGLGRALALLGPVGWLLARDRRAAAILVAPPLLEWLERRPATDPVRFTASTLLGQAAYGAGVLVGCVRQRTVVPLLPRRGVAAR